jgi:hypothetical protein
MTTDHFADMYERAYFGVQKVLDRALGSDWEAGAGGGIVADVEMLAQRAERYASAKGLLEYALHLRMHGERAPGGKETWAEFDRRTEAFLRAEPTP